MQISRITLGRPNGAALGPDGNLYIGFKKTGGVVRINNPAAADATGFGTCDDFIDRSNPRPAQAATAWHLSVTISGAPIRVVRL